MINTGRRLQKFKYTSSIGVCPTQHIQTTHSALLQVDAYFFFGNKVDNSNHGSHVASTAVGNPWNANANTEFDPLTNPDYATGE